MAYDGTTHPQTTTRPTLVVEGVTVPAYRLASGKLMPIMDPEMAFAVAMAKIDRQVAEAPAVWAARQAARGVA